MPRFASRPVLALCSLFFAGGACLDLQVPEQAQITCDVSDPRCPPEWECCEGLCQQQCRCEIGSCDMRFAIDCVEQLLCVDGCWQDCPTCQARCQDPKLKTCYYTGAQGEWFCRQRETCLVRFDDSEGMTADCHTPPPSCQGDNRQRCNCLDDPLALYPPCGPHEQCRDLPPLCVSCWPISEDRPDAGSCLIEGGVDRIDAGVLPSLDGGQASWLDVTPGGGDGGDEGGGVLSLDGGFNGATDAGGQLASDDEVPTCFLTLGQNALGGLCCDVEPRAAIVNGSGWTCEPGWELALRCDGFGDACFTQTSTPCAASESCLWSWVQGGQVQCADYGPPAPCVDRVWQCYAGTRAPDQCACIEPNCP